MDSPSGDTVAPPSSLLSPQDLPPDVFDPKHSHPGPIHPIHRILHSTSSSYLTQLPNNCEIHRPAMRSVISEKIRQCQQKAQDIVVFLFSEQKTTILKGSSVYYSNRRQSLPVRIDYIKTTAARRCTCQPTSTKPYLENQGKNHSVSKSNRG